MASDPKGRDSPGYKLHVFVCGHERDEDAKRPSCGAKDSLLLMKQMKKAAKEEGISDVRVQKSGCLDFCENGISCVVYPEGVWYSLTDENDIPGILEHLRSGKVAEGLRMNLED